MDASSSTISGPLSEYYTSSEEDIYECPTDEENQNIHPFSRAMYWTAPQTPHGGWLIPFAEDEAEWLLDPSDHW